MNIDKHQSISEELDKNSNNEKERITKNQNDKSENQIQKNNNNENKKLLSTLGNKQSRKLIKESNVNKNSDADTNCDYVKLDDTMESNINNKSGNFNKCFKTKTLKQSQTQSDDVDPESKINDIVRKELENSLKNTNDSIIFEDNQDINNDDKNKNNDLNNSVSQNNFNKKDVSDSIIEISGDMLDTNIINDKNSKQNKAKNSKQFKDKDKNKIKSTLISKNSNDIRFKSKS